MNPHNYQLDDLEQPVCPQCGKATNRSYKHTPDLKCWHCGSPMIKQPPIPPRSKRTQQIEAASRECADTLHRYPEIASWHSERARYETEILSTITKLIEPLEKELEEYKTSAGIDAIRQIVAQHSEMRQERDQLKQQLAFANDAAAKGEAGRNLGTAYEECQKENVELRQQLTQAEAALVGMKIAINKIYARVQWRLSGHHEHIFKEFEVKDMQQVCEQALSAAQPSLEKHKQKEELIRELVSTLERLARLGNGDKYGNSEGNVIAQRALTIASALGYNPEGK